MTLLQRLTELTVDALGLSPQVASTLIYAAILAVAYAGVRRLTGESTLQLCREGEREATTSRAPWAAVDEDRRAPVQETGDVDLGRTPGTAGQAKARLQRLHLEGPGSARDMEVDRYETRGELGSGGMGVLFLARDTLRDRLVALKVMADSHANDPRERDRFLGEAQLVAPLSHPNVVQVHDAGFFQGRPCIVFEHVAGCDLQQHLNQHGRFALSEALPILTGIAKALEAVHALGVVHRDIKPANVLLGVDGCVKLGDFGIARCGEAFPPEDVTLGTPHYMAPEQFTGERIDERTDIYGFGATAHHLLCGRAPFEDGDLGHQHVHAPPPDPRESCPELPAPMAELLLACLAKFRGDRPSDAASLLARLEVCASAIA